MSPAEHVRVTEDHFDCFLSYNRKDRDLVRHLDERLRAEAGLRPWLDEYTIPAGELFEPFIRASLGRCATVVICLGPHGWGNFQKKEVEIALALRRETSLRVILAVLPNAPEEDRVSALQRFSEENCLDFGDDIDREEVFWALSKGIAPNRIHQFEGPARLSVYEIRKNAREWNKYKNNDLLYRSSRLQEACTIAAQNLDRLNPTTQEFLLACKQAELEQSRRRLGISMIIALTLAAVASFALWQWTISVRQTRTATAGQLAARAEVLRVDDANRLEQSVLLGLESLRSEETPAGRQAVINGLRWLLLPLTRLDRKGLIELMRFGADGRSLFIASGAMIERWEMPAGKSLMGVSDPSKVTAIASTSLPEQLLATGTDDGNFSLRRMPDERPRFIVKLGSRIDDITFGRDRAPILVRTRGPQPIQAVDPTTGLAVFNGLLADARTAAYSLGGEYLVTLGKDQVLRLHNTVAGTRPSMSVPNVTAFQMSADADHLCAVTSGREVIVWSLKQRRQVAASRSPEGPALKVCALGGSHIFQQGNRIDARDMENGLTLGQELVPKGFRSLAASPDGAYLGVHGFATLAQLRHFRKGILVAIMPVLGQTGTLAFSGDGDMIAAEDWDNSVFVFRGGHHPGYSRVPMEAALPRKLGRRARQIEFQDQDVLFVTARFGAYEWTVGSSKPRAIFLNTPDRRAYRISRDRLRAVTANDERGNVALWEIGDAPKEIWRAETSRELADARFSPDGGRWVALVLKGKSEVREARSGGLHLTLASEVTAVDFDVTGQFLAVAAEQTCVWNVPEKQRVYCAPEAATSVALSRLGQNLALAMPEFVLIRAGGQSRPTVRLPHPGTQVLAFNSDGQYLAAAGGSSDTPSAAPRIWNSDTGVEEAVIPHLENGVYSSASALAFSLDGQTLITAGSEILFHHWRYGGIKQDACGRLTRNLTRGEWGQFFPAVEYRRTCESLPPYGENRVVRTIERVPLFGN